MCTSLWRPAQYRSRGIHTCNNPLPTCRVYICFGTLDFNLHSFNTIVNIKYSDIVIVEVEPAIAKDRNLDLV